MSAQPTVPADDNHKRVDVDPSTPSIDNDPVAAVRVLLSRENVYRDSALALLMEESSMSVCVDDLCRHPAMALLELDGDAILKAAWEIGPRYVIVEEATRRVKPVMRAQRSTLVLRDVSTSNADTIRDLINSCPFMQGRVPEETTIPAAAAEEEEEESPDHDQKLQKDEDEETKEGSDDKAPADDTLGQTELVSLDAVLTKEDGTVTWYATLSKGNKLIDIALWLRSQSIEGKPLQVGVKSELEYMTFASRPANVAKPGPPIHRGMATGSHHSPAGRPRGGPNRRAGSGPFRGGGRSGDSQRGSTSGPGGRRRNFQRRRNNVAQGNFAGRRDQGSDVNKHNDLTGLIRATDFPPLVESEGAAMYLHPNRPPIKYTPERILEIREEMEVAGKLGAVKQDDPANDPIQEPGSATTVASPGLQCRD